MTPDDDVDGQDDVGGEDDRDLADDPDDSSIDDQSPRAADDDRYAWLEGNDGQVVIFDERNPWAWVSSDDPDGLDDRE